MYVIAINLNKVLKVALLIILWYNIVFRVKFIYEIIPTHLGYLRNMSGYYTVYVYS